MVERRRRRRREEERGSKRRLPNPPHSAGSPSLSIYSCPLLPLPRTEEGEKHSQLNCPQVLLFLRLDDSEQRDPLLRPRDTTGGKLEEQSAGESEERGVGVKSRRYP